MFRSTFRAAGTAGGISPRLAGVPCATSTVAALVSDKEIFESIVTAKLTWRDVVDRRGHRPVFANVTVGTEIHSAVAEMAQPTGAACNSSDISVTPSVHSSMIQILVPVVKLLRAQ